MATFEEIPVTTVPGALAALLREHRAAFAAAVVGPDAVDLGQGGSLDGARAAVWLDGADPAALDNVDIPLVAAFPDRADAERVGGTILEQSLAGGSLIGEPGEARVQVEGDGFPSWFLACRNVDAAALGEAQLKLGVAAGLDLGAHVARLEHALEALQQANVRLARENLGRHDAAAGTLVGKFEQRALAAEAEVKEWEQRFLHEQALAIRHHQWFESSQAKLNAPHHRAVERLYRTLLRIPGMRLLFKLLK